MLFRKMFRINSQQKLPSAVSLKMYTYIKIHLFPIITLNDIEQEVKVTKILY